MQNENVIDKFETTMGEQYRLVLTSQDHYMIKRNYLMLHTYDTKEEAKVKFDTLRNYYLKSGMIKAI